MNVLVIGGSGLFGRKIALHLLRDQEVGTVVSLDIVPPPPWFGLALGPLAGKFRFVRGDVADLETLLDVIKANAIDRIVNMAFILTGAFELEPRRAIKVNALGMCNCFEAARLMGLSRLVYASSVAVYGPQAEYGERDVTEDDRLHPGMPYGVTKQLAEMLAEMYREKYGIQASAVRPFLGYGHGGNFPPIIRQFSELVSLPAVGRPFVTEADGNGPSALSSAEDVARLILLLVKAPSSPHPAYNVASRPTTMRDIARAVRKYLPEAHIQFGSQSPPPEAAKLGLPWRASCARAEADFAFALLPLEEAVRIHINDARLDAGLRPL